MSKNNVKNNEALKIVTINVPEAYATCLDILVSHGMYPSRCDAYREAIKELLNEEAAMLPKVAPKAFDALETQYHQYQRRQR